MNKIRGKKCVMIVIGVLALIIVGGAFKYFYDKSHKNTDINDNKQKQLEAEKEQFIKDITVGEIDTSNISDHTRLENIGEKVDISALKSFYKRTLDDMLLTDKDGNKIKNANTVYSPINLYMAMSMLSECCENNSKKQLLDFLQENDPNKLRKFSKNIYESNYINDDGIKSNFANSIWLDKSVNVKKDTFDILSKNYYTSAYKGDFYNDDKLLNFYRDWINKNTNDMFKDHVNNKELSDSVMKLVSTFYIKADWCEKFTDEERKEEYTFLNDSGENKNNVLKLSITEDDMNYSKNDKFEAIKKDMISTYKGGMWFILPDSNSSVDEVLHDESFYDLIFEEDMSKFKEKKVEYYVPKFDVTQGGGTIDKMKKLGVTDIFDSSKADFSNIITNKENPYVNEIEQYMRVKIDKENVEAAAYTDIGIENEAEKVENEFVKIDFNRPFIFVLTGTSGLPMFIGVVNVAD